MSFKSYQEAFDQTVERLAKQGSRALSRSQNACQYRTSTGAMCAVGINLSDKNLNRVADIVCAISGLMESYPEIIDDLKIEGKRGYDVEVFWSKMQGAHDSAHDVTTVKNNFKAAAQLFNLDPAKVELFTTWEGE